MELRIRRRESIGYSKKEFVSIYFESKKEEIGTEKFGLGEFCESFPHDTISHKLPTAINTRKQLSIYMTCVVSYFGNIGHFGPLYSSSRHSVVKYFPVT